MIFFVLFLGGVLWGTEAAGVPHLSIGIGALIVLGIGIGIGIFSAVGRARSKHPC